MILMPDRMERLRQAWADSWPAALQCWSRYIQLHEPVWCLDSACEKRESLAGSFAMIRLLDHSVVISLRQIVELGLERFSKEILAHEIGHHVYCPADLTDNARLLLRIRRGLPGKERFAPMISNLYSDLLINDRLQRGESLDMAGVYRSLKSDSKSGLWLLYMRIYELLWSLPPQSLAGGQYDQRLNQNAQLGARLIRSYARDWLGGAGRFACLCLPYAEDDDAEFQRKFQAWCDAIAAGDGACPDGLAEMDDDELDGIIHPAEDPDLSGINLDELPDVDGKGRVASQNSGVKTHKSYREPFEFAEILKAAGAKLSDREFAARYYRERAIPCLIPFPVKSLATATEPMPEGLDVWDIVDPVDQIDWLGTLLASPFVIPGVTTRERLVGHSPGSDPEKIPIDLYLGVDCSGSMRDPARTLSYPVLAGAIMILSALRAGARVKVVLSGEPGKSVSTDGFVRDPEVCLRTLTNYLGTGYAFGIHRLAETFGGQESRKRPVHILVISDSDMFRMLDEEGSGRVGWDVARQSLQACQGGGTYVLQLPGYLESQSPGYGKEYLERMRLDGWNVHLVNSLEELLAFARQFSRMTYHKDVR
jgi:hypothetical protein